MRSSFKVNQQHSPVWILGSVFVKFWTWHLSRITIDLQTSHYYLDSSSERHIIISKSHVNLTLPFWTSNFLLWTSHFYPWPSYSSSEPYTSSSEPYFTIWTSHFLLWTVHFLLRISHFFLGTSNFSFSEFKFKFKSKRWFLSYSYKWTAAKLKQFENDFTRM